MSTAERRFADALAKARAEWAAADAAACAARAGCERTDGGVLVPLFGRPHLVTHPGGEVAPAEGRRAGADGPGAAPPPVHAAVAILLLHYLLTADGTPPCRDVGRVPRAAGRAVLRGVVRRQGGGAADAGVRRTGAAGPPDPPVSTPFVTPRAAPAATR